MYLSGKYLLISNNVKGRIIIKSSSLPVREKSELEKKNKIVK